MLTPAAVSAAFYDELRYVLLVSGLRVLASTFCEFVEHRAPAYHRGSAQVITRSNTVGFDLPRPPASSRPSTASLFRLLILERQAWWTF